LSLHLCKTNNYYLAFWCNEKKSFIFGHKLALCSLFLKKADFVLKGMQILQSALVCKPAYIFKKDIKSKQKPVKTYAIYNQ